MDVFRSPPFFGERIVGALCNICSSSSSFVFVFDGKYRIIVSEVRRRRGRNSGY